MTGGGGSGSGGSGGSTVTPPPQPDVPAGNEVGSESNPREFPTGKHGRSWAHALWPSKKEYPPAAQVGIQRYSSSEYRQINSVLRQINGDLSKLDDPDFQMKNFDGSNINSMSNADMKKLLQDIDAGMDFAPRVPQWVKLSRGTTWKEFSQFGIASDTDLSTLEGKKYTNHSFTSTSVAGKAAFDDMPVQLNVKVPPGTKGVYMAGSPGPPAYQGALSTIPAENEFLLDRGTKFKITKVTKKQKPSGLWTYEIEVEVIP